MSAFVQDHALPPRRELGTLLMLGAVHFTHILDFMIMMPLGAQLMRVFAITPSQFSYLVASYAVAAAVAGFAGGFVLDRFHRKRALLVLYSGFSLATLACALAPTHHTLLLARIAAGAFGGLAGSMVTAMIGDIVPPARRGRAMAVVMGAFPLASVLGVPAGLVLAGQFGWHAPFFLLAACSAVIWVIAAAVLPDLQTAVVGHRPWTQMREILSHQIHRRAFAVGGAMVVAGGLMLAFLAPSLVLNVGLDEATELPWAYAAGGIATAISTPIIGQLSDRMDRLRLLAIMSACAAITVLIITSLGPTSVAFACFMMAAFMVTMSGRFAPAMAMITNAVGPRHRGGFMSVNAALQQACSAATTAIAGHFVAFDASGRLTGFRTLGYVSVAFFGLTVLLAARLRAAAPHVSVPAARAPVATPAGEAAA